METITPFSMGLALASMLFLSLKLEIYFLYRGYAEYLLFTPHTVRTYVFPLSFKLQLFLFDSNEALCVSR